MSNATRFVQPGTRKLELSAGDWIEVKKQLTVGERKRIDGAGIVAVQDEKGGVQMRVDWAETSFTRTLTYVTAWSFRDAGGNPVAFTREAVEALHPESYAEIEKAIDKHVQEIAQAKKQTTVGAEQPSAS